MRILVTGGCGFIGSHLVDFHLNRGDEVYVVDDLSSGTMQNINLFLKNPNFRFDHSDLLTWPNCEDIVASVDRIYHMAAIIGIFRVLAEPIKVLSANVVGCEKILQAMKSTRSHAKILIASSSSVYGHAVLLREDERLIIEPATHSLWGYAISKIANEALALAYYRSLGIPVIVIRFFNVIGPRQRGRYGMVVPRFIKQALLHDPITVFGDGRQTRSFCDVRDAIHMIHLLMDTSKSHGEIINVGNDYEISINQLAKIILKLSNSQSVIKHIPYKEAYGEEFIDYAQRRPDLSKLNRMIHFKPQWPLEKTIINLLSVHTLRK